TRYRSTKEVSHTKDVSSSSTDVRADIRLDQRLKGLLWYSLYNVRFQGSWLYKHAEPNEGTLTIHFQFPDSETLYDDLRFVINGKDIASTLRPQNGEIALEVPVTPGQTIPLRISYRSRGLDEWRYVPAGGDVANLQDFHLRISTDFTDIDYPLGAISPSSREHGAGRSTLRWDFKQILTGRSMGVVMPAHLQPGKLASMLSFSAPISLLFFYV